MLAQRLGIRLLSARMTEVWFRNPLTYIREAAELLVPNIIWDRGLAWKNKLNPQRHLEIHYPAAVQYRLLLCGDQGTAELRRGFDINNPYAVYPTWEYGEQSIDDLERMLRRQVIPNGSRPDERGRKGQEHRVVIIRAPDSRSELGKAFLETLRDLQFEYKDAIVHYHGTYSYRVAFAYNFRAADLDPVADASKGRIILPNGKIIPHEQSQNYMGWVHLTGYSCSDLAVARNRTMANIKSAQWAGRNWNNDHIWLIRPSSDAPPVDHMSPDVPAIVRTSHMFLQSNRKPQPGDKFLCDRCSLAPTCKYARAGGVCAIPETEANGLARHFKTRDSEQIITGLGRVLEKQIERAERGMEAEKNSDELDPEVTKILKAIYDGGVKLAKLVNPSLNGGPKIGIMVNGGQTVVATEAGLVSTIIAELEAQGIRREDIDSDMVAQYLANKSRAAIEVTAGEP